MDTKLDQLPPPHVAKAPPTNQPRRVVGIGASAGGLEALELFFERVPPDSGMAYVVVQHLSPDFKSLMDEILARRTELPVKLVEHDTEVQANHVYLIPPRKNMIIANGRLLLSDKARDQELSLPIDFFFRSLARDQGSRAVAVVLSGGGTDGSRGIRAVHEAGGMVLVQDAGTAQFDGMPKTALASGVADFVLAPAEMPGAITRGRVSLPDGFAEEPEAGLAAVYGMLDDEFGIDFTHYKPNTITRRIDRRIQLAKAENIDHYVARLRADREELDVLYRDLLIGVTSFFRDEEAFKVLENRVFPELFAARPRNSQLRLWVAGCATGEEVYSLAILLHELSQRLGDRPIQIFATDAHRGSIETASRGLYDEQAVANVSTERLERHFVRRGRLYQVNADIRQMVVFATHNVINDAPFTKVDFVSCRNMLIYLQPPVQRKVLSLFHFALNRHGLAFLGPSETLGVLLNDFETVDKQWRIYRKLTDTKPLLHDRGAIGSRSSLSGARSSPTPLQRYSPSALLSTYDALLEDFIPPSLLINDAGELIHTFGGAAQFLKIRDGRVGLELIDMVSPELRMVLLGALPRTRSQAAPVVLSGVRASSEHPELRFKITLRRVLPRGTSVPHVLIAFEPLHGGPPALAETEIPLDQVSSEQLKALAQELTYTKESLQAATEELESSNQELQTANEELLASNEELQSTNEELQSVNEELYTVNAEYQRKISDLTELSNDMENLLSSTDVGTIFLDRQLRIRKFTSKVDDSFNLMPQDVGRPISAFSTRIDYPKLSADLERVLKTGVPVEIEVRDGLARPSFLRILPYRAKGTIDGVVLTLIDLTAMKATEDALFHERYLLNSLLSNVPDAIYFRDAHGRFIRANEAMAIRLGVDDPKELVGQGGVGTRGGGSLFPLEHQDQHVLDSGEADHYRLEKRSLADGSDEWDLATRLPLSDSSGEVVGVIGILRDVTEQKRAEQAIQEAVRRRDEFLAMLSHELRNPLGAVVSATALLKQAGQTPEKHAEVLDILERQSRQMGRLLDDLLDVSRVTQDKIELREQFLDLNHVVREAVEASRGLIDARGLQLQLRLANEPLTILGDPARLQQIHINLLNNAAKYTQQGGHVMVTTSLDADHARVSVLDNGVGIPAAMQGNIFELFVQSLRTLDRSDGGLGVGLTLVRSLVTKHGGTIEVHSEGEGQGSEFVMRFPLRQGSRSEPGPKTLTRRSPKGNNNTRVVLVEDNADSRMMMCELLEDAGFDCHAAGDGLRGLALIDEICPDVAVVDIGLPGIDGLELARRVRANPVHANMLMIALTGYGQREDRGEALRAGFDRHLVKPVDIAALKRILEDVSVAMEAKAEA